MVLETGSFSSMWIIWKARMVHCKISLELVGRIGKKIFQIMNGLGSDQCIAARTKTPAPCCFLCDRRFFQVWSSIRESHGGIIPCGSKRALPYRGETVEHNFVLSIFIGMLYGSLSSKACSASARALWS
jgi:hypothetical protein